MLMEKEKDQTKIEDKEQSLELTYLLEVEEDEWENVNQESGDLC